VFNDLFSRLMSDLNNYLESVRGLRRGGEGGEVLPVVGRPTLLERYGEQYGLLVEYRGMRVTVVADHRRCVLKLSSPDAPSYNEWAVWVELHPEWTEEQMDAQRDQNLWAERVLGPMEHGYFPDARSAVNAAIALFMAHVDAGRPMLPREPRAPRALVDEEFESCPS